MNIENQFLVKHIGSRNEEVIPLSFCGNNVVQV